MLYSFILEKQKVIMYHKQSYSKKQFFKNSLYRDGDIFQGSRPSKCLVYNYWTPSIPKYYLFLDSSVFGISILKLLFVSTILSLNTTVSEKIKDYLRLKNYEYHIFAFIYFTKKKEFWYVKYKMISSNSVTPIIFRHFMIVLIYSIGYLHFTSSCSMTSLIQRHRTISTIIFNNFKYNIRIFDSEYIE